MGWIKPIFHPAVKFTVHPKVLKTANKQFESNKKLSRSYQNLHRYDICKIVAAVKTTKHSKKFIKLNSDVIKANTYMIFQDK